MDNDQTVYSELVPADDVTYEPFFFTFGCGGPLADRFVVIDGEFPNELGLSPFEDARRKMVALFGLDMWAFQLPRLNWRDPEPWEALQELRMDVDLVLAGRPESSWPVLSPGAVALIAALEDARTDLGLDPAEHGIGEHDHAQPGDGRPAPTWQQERVRAACYLTAAADAEYHEGASGAARALHEYAQKIATGEHWRAEL